MLAAGKERRNAEWKVRVREVVVEDEGRVEGV